ncbi:uncharacterized protein LOC108107711 [Drosophila eugracilis]|uniref:uncharacterized protein LOC108107711 n=1 Tax=Drosophila eugracilis TaxID=29029 RepID=UPI0007E65357|nr:uncharacterized protein LOC108107711 [Drosophila eugracilis]
MRNNKADNTQRQKLRLVEKRQRQRRVWEPTIAVKLLAVLINSQIKLLIYELLVKANQIGVLIFSPWTFILNKKYIYISKNVKLNCYP